MRLINTRRTLFDGARIKAERPPEPEEVYWDQMETKTPELLRRQLLSSAALASIAVVGTAIIAFANYGMGPIMTSVDSLPHRILMQAISP